MAGEDKFFDGLAVGKGIFSDTVEAGGAVTMKGSVIATGVTALILNEAGLALLATGTTLPSDAGALYAKGCLFIDTDVATGTSGLYVNEGTAASCSFKLVTNA